MKKNKLNLLLIQMGILGYSSSFDKPSNCLTLDICNNFIYSNIDWVYTYVEHLYAYDYKIVYFWFLSSIYDDSFDFFFLTFWYFNIDDSCLQFFWASMLDIYVASNLSKFVLTESWYRGFVFSKESTFVVLQHPELLFIKSQILNNFFINYLTDINISIFEFIESESFITPIMLLPQLIFIVYFILMFISFYFSFYSTASKEESTVDTDYLLGSVLVESEKEIGSMDDLLIGIVVFLYVFGWYFYIHAYTIYTTFPEMAVIFYFFPIMYYLIFCMPCFLLYDFGIFFCCYLRGVAPTPVLIFELMYDYIAVIAFFTRIVVQGIRLALMAFTYAGMHDVILYYSYDQRLFIGSESLWEELSNIEVSFKSITYFFLFILPGHIIYWMYELFHTFFVVTGQFIAYFSMIFWLFLFLFTFFITEKQENYFFEKRLVRRKLLYKLKNYSNNKG